MKRDCLQDLHSWKLREDRRPLLLRGARQVGKSWLVRELAKSFDDFVEVNFEEEPGLISIFADSLNPNEILTNLSHYLVKKIEVKKTLLFFDEIQEAPRAIIALRYFYEKIPDLHVIAAGSLIEFELENIGFPVGRVEQLYVYPLSFGEFLDAAGEAHFRKSLQDDPNQKIPDIVHKKYLKLVRDYTLVGGMPEVVKTFFKDKDLTKCSMLQASLIEVFIKDFKKYAKKKMVPHVATVFNATPLMLGHKFVWARINSQVKSTVLGNALNLLEQAGLVYKIYHSSSNGVPLKSEINPKKFKVLFFDIGLAQRLLCIDVKSMILRPDISQVNNGALAELYTGLELLKYQPNYIAPELYYWHREQKQSSSEIDYVIAKDSKIFPIEVKSGSTGRLKSLNFFMQKKKVTTGYKINQNQYLSEGHIHSIPFYRIEYWYKHLC